MPNVALSSPEDIAGTVARITGVPLEGCMSEGELAAPVKS